MQRTTGKKYSQYRTECTNEFRKIKSNYYNKQCCDIERENMEATDGGVLLRKLLAFLHLFIRYLNSMTVIK